MTQWNFYFSGILYGKIREDEETLTLQKRIIETGKWTPWRPFSDEDDQAFALLCNRSLLGFFGRKKEYEQKIANRPETFATKDEESFARRGDDSYIQRGIKFPKDLFYDEDGIYSVVMCARDVTAVLVKKGRERETVLRDWEDVYPGSTEEDGEYQPGPVYGVEAAGTFMVPTRDGEQLATDVYLPTGTKETRFPTVLVRTPYGKGKDEDQYYRFLQRGYAVVVQDTRGREDSTGEWMPEYYEIEDGDDTLNWIAAQPFSDGQVSMTGGSYLGYVQWAAAASGNPHLKAMLSSVCAGSAFIDIPRRGGCFNSGMLAWAFMMTEKRLRADLVAQDNWDEILDIRPLNQIPKQALGHEVPFLEKWLEHTDMDAFWERGNWSKRYQGGQVPALIMSGWFDDNGMGTTEALDLVQSWEKGTWKAVLGPWKHSGNAQYDLHALRLGDNALRYDMDILCMKWLEHFLKGVDNGIEKTPAVEYYTIGENQWKTAERWPVETSERKMFYLEGGDIGLGQASSANGTGEACGSGVLPKTSGANGTGEACGRGVLSDVLPETSGADVYDYDPDHPSVHIIDMSENELEVPEEYTDEEKRADMLSYSTPVLTEPLTITGDMLAELYVSCDCPDTDFVVRVCDVDENGRSVKLADGVIGAKYRNGFDHPEYMEPGEIYKITIRTTKLSNTFLPGHRMRVTITSSAKNFIFPNSNTKDGFNSRTRQKAHVTIYRGGEHASGIWMPIEKA